MQIVDLRQLTSRQLEPLLAEEAQQWGQQLRWDYRASVELIKKFVDARSLTGTAVMEGGRPVGYAFYVLEEYKGLIGGLFVSPTYSQQELSCRLLTDTLITLSGIPKLERVEAQLIPFGYSLDPVLSEYGFRVYMRQFMIAPLPPSNGVQVLDVLPGLIEEAPGAGLILDRWDHRYFEPSARLIQLAYANHVDGEINDQYRSESGALRFLKNIIILPGCGQFQPEASFVLRRAACEPSCRRDSEFVRFRRRRTHHANLRHARIPGTRPRPAPHAGVHAGAARAQLHQGVPHRDLGKRARRAPI